MAATLKEMIASARAAVQAVPVDEAGASLERGEIDVVLDVREPAEFETAHLPGAINIPRGWLEIRADPASPGADPNLTGDQSARILVYCTRAPGARSVLATQTLASMGYDKAAALDGGLNAWVEAGLEQQQGSA
jgi:rhodanese-related sulfurtransferase